MARAHWTRSDDGYTESKCGRFRIEPQWLGRTRPQFYVLHDSTQPQMKSIISDTQLDCKAEAERILAREAKAAADKAFADTAVEQVLAEGTQLFKRCPHIDAIGKGCILSAGHLVEHMMLGVPLGEHTDRQRAERHIIVEQVITFHYQYHLNQLDCDCIQLARKIARAHSMHDNRR